jgi:hypothetical protein
VTPQGYVANNTAYEIKDSDFTVAAYDEGTAYFYELSVVNKQIPIYGRLDIRNTDGEGNPIANAEFEIRRPDMTYEAAKTDKDGYIRISNLLIDRDNPSNNVYRVTQTKMPGSFVPHEYLGKTAVFEHDISLDLDGTDEAKISKTGDTEVTVVNTLVSVKLKLITVRSTDKITRARTLLTRTDGTAVSGMNFVLYDEEGQEVSSDDTANDGIVRYDALDIGKLYKASQSAPADEYIFDDLGADTYFMFDKGGVPHMSNEQGDDLGVFIAGMVMVRNVPEPGNDILTVRKLGITDIEDVPVEGAKFAVEVCNANKNKYEPYAELTTLPNGEYTLSDIGPGTYRVRELSSKTPFTVSPDIYFFTVKQFGESQTSGHTWYGTTQTPEVVKGRLVGTFDIRFSDGASALENAENEISNPRRIHTGTGGVELLDGLSGAEYDLEIYEGLSYIGKTPIETIPLVSDEDGDLCPLPSAFYSEYTYVFRETKAPDGYGINANVCVYQPAIESANIEKFGKKQIALKDTDIKHGITLSKYASDTGLPLAAAEFTLYDSSGASAGDYVTGADGTIRITGLTRGIYYLKETAAQGYAVPENTYIRFVLQDEIQGINTPVISDMYRDAIDDGANTITETTPTLANAYKVLYNDPSAWNDTITIKKKLYGKTGNESVAMDDENAESFAFKVTYGEGSDVYTGPYTLYLFDGDTVGTIRSTLTDGTITLKGGQRATIHAIDEGEEFTVREYPATAGKYDVYTRANGTETETESFAGELRGNMLVTFKNIPAKYTVTYAPGDHGTFEPQKTEGLHS